jgi:hypothetical protein
VDVISDCGPDLRVVGVRHRIELLDRKGPGKHGEAGLFQSCHRGKREGAGSPLHCWLSCGHGSEDIVNARPAQLEDLLNSGTMAAWNVVDVLQGLARAARCAGGWRATELGIAVTLKL